MSPTAEPVATPVVTVTPFVAADAWTMTLTDRARAGLRDLDLETAYQSYERGGGWTLRVDGAIVGAAGLSPMWPGVAAAWLFPSPLLARYPRTVVATVVAHLRALIAERQLRRVQCSVQADHVIGRRFVEWLGFEPEARMTAYGPNGEDHILYAWIRPAPAP